MPNGVFSLNSQIFFISGLFLSIWWHSAAIVIGSNKMSTYASDSKLISKRIDFSKIQNFESTLKSPVFPWSFSAPLTSATNVCRVHFLTKVISREPWKFQVKRTLPHRSRLRGIRHVTRHPLVSSSCHLMFIVFLALYSQTSLSTSNDSGVRCWHVSFINEQQSPKPLLPFG